MTLRPTRAGRVHWKASQAFEERPVSRWDRLTPGRVAVADGGEKPRVLLVDHQDSFVHNLARYFQLVGCDVTIRRSYTLESGRVPEEGFRAIILSPGPRRPCDEPKSLALVQELAGKVPMLGVCLGHQIIAEAFGAKVVESSAPCHGRGTWIRYVPHPCFAGLPNPFQAGRYHSLRVAAESLPDDIIPLAWTDDGSVMALCHRRWDVVGWQFHPESILTPVGPRLIQAFLHYAGAAKTGAASAPANGRAFCR